MLRRTMSQGIGDKGTEYAQAARSVPLMQGLNKVPRGISQAERAWIIAKADRRENGNGKSDEMGPCSVCRATNT
jgi:hypothetical protein